MDAPGARANEETVKNTPGFNSSTARSPSPSGITQDDHEQRHQSSESSRDGSIDSDQSNEEGDDEEEEREGARGENDDDDDDEDEEDEEPRLKYAYLTKHLGSVYRNGDATSTFLVAGDKMVRLLF